MQYTYTLLSSYITIVYQLGTKYSSSKSSYYI